MVGKTPMGLNLKTECPPELYGHNFINARFLQGKLAQVLVHLQLYQQLPNTACKYVSFVVKAVAASGSTDPDIGRHAA